MSHHGPGRFLCFAIAHRRHTNNLRSGNASILWLRGGGVVVSRADIVTAFPVPYYAALPGFFRYSNASHFLKGLFCNRSHVRGFQLLQVARFSSVSAWREAYSQTILPLPTSSILLCRDSGIARGISYSKKEAQEKTDRLTRAQRVCQTADTGMIAKSSLQTMAKTQNEACLCFRSFDTPSRTMLRFMTSKARLGSAGAGRLISISTTVDGAAEG